MKRPSQTRSLPSIFNQFMLPAKLSTSPSTQWVLLPEAPDEPLRSQLKSRSPVLDSAGLHNYIYPSTLGPSCFSYQQLCEATQNFHSSRFLFKGGFGPVYKGDIDGEFVAVKCLNNDSKQGFKEFRAEINIISDLRHRNLVRLRGWCNEDNKYFVVYDFVARGSLDTILFDDERCRSELSWERRFGIVLGLSSALQYLHEDCDKVIIHRDIQTSNVLVDEKYAAKLGDFGLSRDVGDSETFTTVVADPTWHGSSAKRTPLQTNSGVRGHLRKRL